jgi:hypothetical protein
MGDESPNYRKIKLPSNESMRNKCGLIESKAPRTGGKKRGDLLNVLSRIFLTLFLLAGMLRGVSPVSAQEEGIIRLSTIEIKQFPTIQFYMDAYNGENNFISNLKPAEIQIIEDGQALAVEEIEGVTNGLQIILSLNTSSLLGATRSGAAEYERVQTALETWARAQQPKTIDDYSLATPTGLYLIRSQETEQLVQAITNYTPDLAANHPPLNSLAEALDMATDPLEQPLMKRAILYITPPLPEANLASIPDMAARAQEIGVRVNVWLLASPTNNGASQNQLELLAEMTGGRFHQIAAEEPLPDIEQLFQPQRQTYRVRYTSGVQKSGEHSISVKINRPSAILTSALYNFNLTVLPPNPIFLSPPAAVSRAWSLEQKDAQPVLVPNEIPLQIMVEFPDQFQRQIQATRLFVDGILVDENLEAPFDSFTWPVAEFSTTQRHMLRAEAVDILGLSGSSMEVPIDIVIEQPAQNTITQQLSGKGMIAVAAVAVSGTALALVLLLTNTQRRLRWKRQLTNKKMMKDPVTQPVVVKPVNARKERTQPKKDHESTPRPSWPLQAWQRASSQTSPAQLVCLDENEQPITGGIVPLNRQEITFGSDPRRATQVLNSPTVDGLHARLYRSDDEQYYLADQNSIAGTWINYAPVNSSGARLEHGDLIHIGKVMFRFEITEPARTQPAEIKVTILE